MSSGSPLPRKSADSRARGSPSTAQGSASRGKRSPSTSANRSESRGASDSIPLLFFSSKGEYHMPLILNLKSAFSIKIINSNEMIQFDKDDLITNQIGLFESTTNHLLIDLFEVWIK